MKMANVQVIIAFDLLELIGLKFFFTCISLKNTCYERPLPLELTVESNGIMGRRERYI